MEQAEGYSLVGNGDINIYELSGYNDRCFWPGHADFKLSAKEEKVDPALQYHCQDTIYPAIFFAVCL